MYSATLISLTKASHYEFETVLDLPVQFNAAECQEVIIEQFIARYFSTSSDTQIAHFVSNDERSPMIITVRRAVDDDERHIRIHAVISTPEKDEKFYLSSSDMRKSSKHKSLSDKRVLRYIMPDIAVKKFRKAKSSPQVLAGLQTMAKMGLEFLHSDKKFKIGVIHYRGEVDESSLFEKKNSTLAFDRFISVLGDLVELKGFKGFTGGLDNRRDLDGTHTIYSKWKDAEVVFHVTSLIDGDSDERKVHIGNNAVNIVFVDHEEGEDIKPFSPHIITSKFNQVFIVIAVERDPQQIRKAKKAREDNGGSSPRSQSSYSSASVLASPRSPRKIARTLRGLNSSADLTSAQMASPRYSVDLSQFSKKLLNKDFNSIEIISRSPTPRSGSRTVTGPDSPRSKPLMTPDATSVKLSSSNAALDDDEDEIYYRVCVVRREGVPSFLPRVPFPNIIKHGNNLKEFLLDKLVNSTIAAYKAPTFQERLLKNRRSFLEQVIRSIDKTEAV
jgi:hypothetical protein